MALLGLSTPRRNLLLIGVIFEVTTLIAIVLGSWVLGSAVMHAYSSTKWPETKGTVTVGTDSAQVGNASQVGAIWYEYLIAGKTYRSSRVTFFTENELYQRRQGETVKVFYNPIDLSDSCLVTGVGTGALIEICLYAFLILSGLLTLSLLVYEFCIKKTDETGKGNSLPQILAATSMLKGMFFPW
jgi:hypothetical protein